MTEPQGPEDFPTPRHGWRGMWRVLRVGIVIAAFAVVGANLVRCYVLPAGAAEPSAVEPDRAAAAEHPRKGG